MVGWVGWGLSKQPAVLRSGSKNKHTAGAVHQRGRAPTQRSHPAARMAGQASAPGPSALYWKL